MLWNTKWFPGTNLQDINLDWILKKVGALRGGRTGQYLYKKSDKDFDFGWKTGGGGGGSSDYLDLDNKPSINNVELTGNKTAADLGLATPSDIPSVPVQSVNGKTGAVELDASDVGAYVKPATGIPKTDLDSAVQESLDKADSAYSKPATGIPKTDLDSAVQASLNKADTALQAVPTTYRTAAAQDTIDAAQDAKIDSLAGSLAMVESSPATTAHVVGEYIVYNGHLYKVTAAIAAGQTLTPGTNISATSMAENFITDSDFIDITAQCSIPTGNIGFVRYMNFGKVVFLIAQVFNINFTGVNVWLQLPDSFPGDATLFTALATAFDGMECVFRTQSGSGKYLLIQSTQVGSYNLTGTGFCFT